MSAATESVTLTVPRSAVADVLTLSASLTDRMHQLLERNTDDALTTVEREELATLTQMVQFSQILTLALSSVDHS